LVIFFLKHREFVRKISHFIFVVVKMWKLAIRKNRCLQPNGDFSFCFLYGAIWIVNIYVDNLNTIN
jgi:hypothetical protein